MSAVVVRDGVEVAGADVPGSAPAPRRGGESERLERDLRRMALLHRRAAVARRRRRRGGTALRG